jgi:hypothetical protein
MPSAGNPINGGPVRTRAAGSINWGLAGLAVVGCAFVGLVDPGKAWFYPQCPFKAMTGFDCPGCGVTRALHSTVTGNPLRALDHNALLTVAFVLGVVGFGWSKVRRWTGKAPIKWRLTTTGAVGLGVFVCLFWVTRNMPWEPMSWLGSGLSGRR